MIEVQSIVTSTHHQVIRQERLSRKGLSETDLFTL